MSFSINSIRKPTDISVNATGPLKIEDSSYTGYVTVAIEIELGPNKEKYVVRRFFEESSLAGKSNEEILNDKAVKAGMLEMVEKMVNIGVAYNLGRDKGQGNVIKEIALERDQHTITRIIGIQSNAKDLTVAVPKKYAKYLSNGTKPDNAKRQALRILYDLYAPKHKIGFEDTIPQNNNAPNLSKKPLVLKQKGPSKLKTDSTVESAKATANKVAKKSKVAKNKAKVAKQKQRSDKVNNYFAKKWSKS